MLSLKDAAGFETVGSSYTEKEKKGNRKRSFVCSPDECTLMHAHIRPTQSLLKLWRKVLQKEKTGVIGIMRSERT